MYLYAFKGDITGNSGISRTGFLSKYQCGIDGKGGT
jgi:hypothetical protein